MNKLSMDIVTFANNNKDVLNIYDGMRDYFRHYMSEVENKNIGSFDSTKSLTEKDAKMHKALLSEVERISFQKRPENMPLEAWLSNPQLRWATFAVISSMIEAVIPDTIIKDIGRWCEIKNIGFGDTAEFNIAPNSLLTVSQGSNAQRTTFHQKQFKSTKTLVPVNHDVTVEVSLYRVFCGQESLAEFARKAIISMETLMSADAYDALVTLVDGATFPTALKETGYTESGLLNLCQKVSAYNRSRATIMGTAQALRNILPSVSDGYRINTPSDAMNIQLLKTFYDYDIMVMPQVATGIDYGLKLDDKKIFVMSSGVDKVIKGAVEGSSMSNTQEFYSNADLTSTATLNKRWIFEAITNATMGVMKIA